MEKIKVQIFAKEGVEIPEYKTISSAGMDVRTNIGPIGFTMAPNERRLFPTGISTAIPVGYEIQIRSRSGLVLKKGLKVANQPATIDADYRGEIGIILHNTSVNHVRIKSGERIAQLVLKRAPQIEWEQVSTVEELGMTTRGVGGFGHTGTN